METVVSAEAPRGLNFAADEVVYSDRVCSAEETYERIAPFLPKYGITRLASLTSLDRIGIPVWNAVAPNARSITICQGKGITEVDAKVSAAMEALERAVAGRPDVTIVTGSYRSLTDGGARVTCLSGLISTGNNDLHADESVEWVIGIDILTGDPIYLPYEATALDRTRNDHRFWQSSDGLASGNTFEEAVLHGMLERIERDAYALWQVNPPEAQAGCCVDQALLQDPVIVDMTRKIESAGMMLRLFDMTTEIGTPCFTALLAPRNILDDRHARFLDVTHGSGAHPDPGRAMIRAITEAAQSRLTFISGGRDDIDPQMYQRPLPDGIRTQLMTKGAKSPIPAGKLPQGSCPLLEQVKALLVKAGIREIFAVRLNAVDNPFAVTKIFIPGLEHPEGRRRQRFGSRAINRSLGIR